MHRVCTERASDIGTEFRIPESCVLITHNNRTSSQLQTCISSCTHATNTCKQACTELTAVTCLLAVVNEISDTTIGYMYSSNYVRFVLC